MTDAERAKQAGEKVDRAADWFDLRQLAERLFVADYPVASQEYSSEAIARAAFMAAESFIAEANKRAPK
jgi:hypothetical protein